MKTFYDLDEFTRAYLEAALWSSTEYAYGECPCCGEMALLTHYPELEFDQVPMCSAEGCGVVEISNPEPVDANYDYDDLSEAAILRAESDCAEFQRLHGVPEYGDRRYTDNEKAGHDFWLTRNGHGTGFWDRGLLDEVGKRFTDAAKAFGQTDLVCGGDGKLHLEGGVVS